MSHSIVCSKKFEDPCSEISITSLNYIRCQKGNKVDLFKIIFDSLSNDTSSLELYAHRKQSTVMKVLFICHKFQLQFLHNIVDKTPLMQHILFCWIDFFFTISTKKFKFSWFFIVDLLSQNSLLCFSHTVKYLGHCLIRYFFSIT